MGLAVRELELCRLQGDETVLLYTDPDSREDVAGALFGAANMLSDQAFEVVVPGVRAGRRAGMPNAVAALSGSVDLMIDATSRGMCTVVTSRGSCARASGC